MTNQEMVVRLSALVRTANKFRTCYLWSGDNGNAALRESYEKFWSIPAFEFVKKGHKYSFAFTVEQSRKNTYARGEYYRDGERVTLRVVKQLLANAEKGLARKTKRPAEEN